MDYGQGSVEHLSREYMRIQQIIEDFDSKALTIKAWSVTLSAAGIVTSYTQKVPMILLIASGSALVFWIIEALWKTSQQAYYKRVYAIENYFVSPTGEFPPYQIATSWSHSWHTHGRGALALKIMVWPRILLPHAIVATVAATLFLVAPPLGAIPS
ncbi:MAG: hypothetical protein E5V49_06820 [Mesorhizobium sp.]|nr:hypothetical protein EN848_26615 [bacterium M00.F.Ca.ET.205.01.1.1]TGU48506.1 hypothetical protein EN795_27895 [bacterium M00.F.Ca.ET.152.01.1.1]TGV32764.1 hypothetical protein EN829_027440 [Mesorhizobium sp. M00.F.Ca.ET.186.01.1.1]TGZ40022.1 hypothetical protein EN805_27290 [bacterium M00.F.Ca.ET.162.01.1.1]TIW62345.1 MAG: hypothetical protein E5V48_04935 [Mesorhizobium sp.]